MGVVKFNDNPNNNNFVSKNKIKKENLIQFWHYKNINNN